LSVFISSRAALELLDLCVEFYLLTYRVCKRCKDIECVCCVLWLCVLGFGLVTHMWHIWHMAPSKP